MCFPLLTSLRWLEHIVGKVLRRWLEPSWWPAAPCSWWLDSQFLAHIFHLELSAHLKVANALLQLGQVLNEHCVELSALVELVFQVILAHQRKVNSLVELLAGWVDGH